MEKSYAIFSIINNPEDDFYQDLLYFSDNSTLIIPLHINRNHWCVITADIATQLFIYVDENEYELKKNLIKHLNIFVKFFKHVQMSQEFIFAHRLLPNLSLPIDSW